MAARLRVVVIGSSVARGSGATADRGWAAILADALAPTVEVVNVSENGADTAITIDRFSQFVPKLKPDFVIIGLSLANEGLGLWGSVGGNDGVCKRYEKGVLRLMKLVSDIGAVPIVGGVYPHQCYTQSDIKCLMDTHQRMMAWDCSYIDFMAAVSTGQTGLWDDGLAFDAGHPNDAGHKRMFEAIDQNLFVGSLAETGMDMEVERGDLGLGTVMLIEGLQSAAQYNGRYGIVVGKPLASGRFPVQLHKSDKVLQVKSSNLRKPQGERAPAFELRPQADLIYDASLYGHYSSSRGSSSGSGGGKVFLGDLYTASHPRILRAIHGITHILNCATEIQSPPHASTSAEDLDEGSESDLTPYTCEIDCGSGGSGTGGSGSGADQIAFEYLHLHLRDKCDEDIEGRGAGSGWSNGVAFLHAAMRVGGSVFVHCVQGKSRSSACILAFLLTHCCGGASQASATRGAGAGVGVAAAARAGGGSESDVMMGEGVGSSTSASPPAPPLTTAQAPPSDMMGWLHHMQTRRPKASPNLSFLLSLMQLEERLPHLGEVSVYGLPTNRTRADCVKSFGKNEAKRRLFAQYEGRFMFKGN